MSRSFPSESKMTWKALVEVLEIQVMRMQMQNEEVTP